MLKTDTAMTSAFAKAGLRKRQLRLYAPLSEFIKAGGTRNELLAVYEMIAPRTPVADQSGTGAHAANVGGRQTDRGGDGHPEGETQPNLAGPVREPSAEQNAATSAVRKSAALSVFDRIKTARGAMWGNITYIELSGMRDDGDIAREVKAHIGQLLGKDRLKTVRDLMTPREFHACLRKAGRAEHEA